MLNKYTICSYESLNSIKGDDMKTKEQIQKEIEKEIPGVWVMTTEEFIKQNDAKCLIRYDGIGMFHDGENETEFSVWDDYPAGLDNQEDVIKAFPYVCWYNR